MADVITRFKVETTEYNQKIDRSKEKLNQLGKQGQDTGRMFQEFTNKLGVSIPKLGALSLGIGAVTGALKVAKDAFFKNEGTLDEWGRMVESSKTIYEGFLVSLNTGDFSGFITRINSIITAARNAYDALDELATFNAFNQVNVEKGRYEFQESIVNFKDGSGSKEAVEEAANNLKKQLEERRKKEQEAYESKLREYAARDGVDYESLKAVMTGKYGDYESLKKLGLTGVKSEWDTTMYGAPYEIKSRVAANEEEKMGQMLRQLNDTELQNLQALGAQAQRTAQEMEQINRQVLRYTNETTKKSGSGGGKSGPSDEDLWRSGRLSTNTIKNLQTGLAAANRDVLEAADAETRAHAQNTVRIIQQEIERLKTGLSTFDGGMGASYGVNGIDMSNLQIDPSGIEHATNSWKQYTDTLKASIIADKEAYSAIGQIGSALAGIENPAAKVLGIVAQAVATTALAYAETLAKDKTSKSNIWSFIAASAASTISMVSTISAMKNATKFADGGIVQGNHYSGDQDFARVNAGELILNRAQQGNIASQLANGASSMPVVEFKIKDTELVGILSGYNSRKSRRL